MGRLSCPLLSPRVLLALHFERCILLLNPVHERGLVVIFALIGIFVWRVFSEIERDPVLSPITHTGEGRLIGEFWMQLTALGSLPLC